MMKKIDSLVFLVAHLVRVCVCACVCYLQGMKDKSQTLIQGGVVCFDGTRETFFHKDEGTGAHADFDAAIATLI